MNNANSPTALRRSSRVPTALPILVTTLDGTQFSEVCETVVVNAHGCAIVSPVKFDSGVPLRLHTKQGRETTAHVVCCQPIGLENQTWRLGAKFDHPGNLWGLSNCPEDWELRTLPLSSKLQQSPSPVTTSDSGKAPGQVSQSPEVLLDLVARRLEAPLRRMLAESLSPLQSQVTALKEKLAIREANPSRFEVSLSSIPPELEQQLESRLRKDIGPRVLDDSRQQYAHLLDAAKTTIHRTTKEGYQDFLRLAGEELKAVEARAQDISAQISADAREHVRCGVEEFQQKLLDGGTSLKRLSEELLEFLQHSLNDDHNARRADLEQVRASVASESSRLHKHVEELNMRIARLNETTRSLESGVDKRLSEMCSNTMKDARNQLESITSAVLEGLTTRGTKIVGDQLDEASAKMAAVQNNMIASASQTIHAEATSASQAFEHSVEETTRVSLEDWRRKLADGLSAVASSLGEKFKSAADLGEERADR